MSDCPKVPCKALEEDGICEHDHDGEFRASGAAAPPAGTGDATDADAPAHFDANGAHAWACGFNAGRKSVKWADRALATAPAGAPSKRELTAAFLATVSREELEEKVEAERRTLWSRWLGEGGDRDLQRFELAVRAAALATVPAGPPDLDAIRERANRLAAEAENACRDVGSHYGTVPAGMLATAVSDAVALLALAGAASPSHRPECEFHRNGVTCTCGLVARGGPDAER